MLVNLQTTHRPQTLRAAQALLSTPGNYPIYGSGGYLFRMENTLRRDVQATVDLSELVSNMVKRYPNDQLFISGAATLQAVSEAVHRGAEVIKGEFPATLRNTLTIGDLLMELPSNSLSLALLYGLGAQIDTPRTGEDDLIELGRWFGLSVQERRQHIVQGVVIWKYAEPWRFAVAKVSRTPADAPIVGAIGFAYAGETNPGSYAVVVGVEPHPVRYHSGLVATVEDYKGSAAYRTEMARILSEQAIEAAEHLARQG
jgi:CO/xanthine dehydrogenase FAD-binding subunit